MADILALQELATDSDAISPVEGQSSESGICSTHSYAGCA